ncbi:hypothetical protein HYY69_04455 [Candidatus Woesearchaeota archaeon]|nr:hypothetical protein [Candidatus Woesearchaeota archaeon]
MDQSLETLDITVLEDDYEWIANLRRIFDGETNIKYQIAKNYAEFLELLSTYRADHYLIDGSFPLDSTRDNYQYFIPATRHLKQVHPEAKVYYIGADNLSKDVIDEYGVIVVTKFGLYNLAKKLVDDVKREKLQKE